MFKLKLTYFAPLLIFFLLSPLFARGPVYRYGYTRVTPNHMGGYNYYEGARMVGRSTRNYQGGENFFDTKKGYTWQSFQSYQGTRINNFKK